MEKEISTNNKNNNQKGYGLLSMMAMIIGLVIGSGIFAKNVGLIDVAGSVGMVIFAWVITSLLIVTLSIAFIEVISITEITGEQSTVNNWGKHLLGIRFGKTMGYYMAYLYFPITIASLYQYTSDQLLLVIPGLDYQSLSENPLQYMGTVFLIAFILMAVVMLINSVFTKPGKYFQNVGTVIKTIPLFFIVIVFLTVVGNTKFINWPLQSELIDQGVVDKSKSTTSPLLLLIATMPAILYSFDGYIIAGELSNEAKGPAHFRIAFIVSVIFIIIIYILFSVATLGLGSLDSTLNGGWKYGTMNNAIYTLCHRKGWSEATIEGIALTNNIIIFISMLTAASGFSIAAYRSLSDLSAIQIIKDERNLYVTKNNHGIAPESGYVMTAITFLWFTIAIIMDFIIAETMGLKMVMCDFASNFITVGIYFLQTLIIVFALVNRFTNKVKTKKNIFFIPTAIISSIFIAIVTFINLFVIFYPVGGEITTVYLVEILYTLMVLISLGIIYWYQSKKLKEITEEMQKEKDIKVSEYYSMPMEKYLELKDSMIIKKDKKQD